MGETFDALRRRLEQGVAELEQIGEAVRARIGTAGQEARENWQKLEPRIAELKHAASGVKDEVVESVNKAVDEVKAAAEELRKKL
ncbi:MAG TPA: hypothetical protein VG755_33790 [Nannocystaceae bacterium]|nr:hypothetical protein [Nannocystaceae bacterium]